MLSVRIPQQSSIMTVMTRAVLKASKGLLRDFAELEKLQVSIKSNKTFVTSADIHASKVLKDELLHARPKYSFLSEEHELLVGEDCDHRWIVDPLDGTVNYMHGLPHWAISVALEEKGEVVAAVTYAPVINEMYWTEKGRGAYLNDQKIRVSSKRSLPEILVSFGNLAESKLPPIARLPLSVRKLGAMTLDMAYLAAGRLDLLYSSPNSNPWDIAAGALLIREAGGVLADSSARSVTSYDKIEMMANIDLLDVVRKYQNAN